MSRLEKRKEELEKARKKYEDWGKRVKELERQYKEEEKTTIHEMVTAAELTPEELSRIIRLAKAGEIYYGKLAEKCEEDEYHEE